MNVYIQPSYVNDIIFKASDTLNIINITNDECYNCEKNIYNYRADSKDMYFDSMNELIKFIDINLDIVILYSSSEECDDKYSNTYNIAYAIYKAIKNFIKKPIAEYIKCSYDTHEYILNGLRLKYRKERTNENIYSTIVI